MFSVTESVSCPATVVIDMFQHGGAEMCILSFLLVTSNFMTCSHDEKFSVNFVESFKQIFTTFRIVA